MENIRDALEKQSEVLTGGAIGFVNSSLSPHPLVPELFWHGMEGRDSPCIQFCRVSRRSRFLVSLFLFTQTSNAHGIPLTFFRFVQNQFHEGGQTT